MAEEYTGGVFNEDEDEELEDIEPLVSEPFHYDNIVNNPILKPISETDRSLRDLDEMVYKRLINANNDKKWINKVITEIPFYEESQFVSRLIRFAREYDDLIKLEGLKNKNLKKCIREMVNIVKERYGVRMEEEGKFFEPETIIPEEGYEKYLEKMGKHSEEKIANVAKEIIKVFKTDNTADDIRDKFENACMGYYKEEADKNKKNIASKIMRMEYK